MSVLETRSLSIRFGGIQAARDVSIKLGDIARVRVDSMRRQLPSVTLPMIRWKPC